MSQKEIYREFEMSKNLGDLPEKKLRRLEDLSDQEALIRETVGSKQMLATE